MNILAANTDVISSGFYYYYDDVWKKFKMDVYYFIYKDGEVYLQVYDSRDKCRIKLKEEDLEKLKKNVDKYFEWEKIALEKEVMLEKELPDSMIKTDVVWTKGEYVYTAEEFELHFKFFSQNPKRHQLVIFSNRVYSKENLFIDFSSKKMYLEDSQVYFLGDNLKKENIKERISEIEKENKEKEALFN